MALSIYENWAGNIELTYPATTPHNPIPERKFHVTLCKGNYDYYFKNSSFLGHEPAEVSEKWREMFDTNYSRDNSGSKEKMIARMDEFMEWLSNR